MNYPSQVKVHQKVVSVWTLTPIDRPLDYLVGDLEICIGDIVYVLMGTRQVRAVVWEGSDRQDIDNLKSIASKSSLPPMRPEIMSFLQRMSEFVIAPLGMVIKLALRVTENDVKQKKWLKPKILPDNKFSPKQSALHDWLWTFHRHGIDPKDIEDFSRQIQNGLVAKGGAEWVEPLQSQVDHISEINPKSLSEAQKHAVDAISKARKPVLLKGVTGSGKTEVYFEILSQALSAGQQALVLLPEIALTEKFIERCEARFGFRPKYWHSNMTASARRQVWRKVSDGSVPIVVGARSSLFLPFQNLGVIVVDEEHDSGYKQEEGVIYHGRDMAVLRAFFEDARVILASATPSIETMHNAREGKYERVDINERFGDAQMPDIEIANMINEPLDPHHWIGSKLVHELEKRIARKEQSLLFMNRRGFAPLLLCRACGHQIECPSCDARLVEHRSANRLQCHQCGFETSVPTHCPNCHESDRLVAIGPGVERIAQEIQTHFPDARVCVLSSDLLQGEAQLSKTIAAIADGEYEIIVGTQMIAKGHNFPLLTLVGIIDMDSGLEGGDLRAAERSFQLLRQVAGRAGRADRPGLAIVQTYQPHHPLLNSIISDNDSEFYELQIEERKAALAPPFVRYIAIIIAAPDLEDAMQFGRALLASSQKLKDQNIQIFGPVIAPISRIRGRARVRMLLRAPKNAALHEQIKDWCSRVKKRSRTKVQIDVDPQTFF